MNVPGLENRTHSRRPFLAFGLVFVLVGGLVGLYSTAVFAASPDFPATRFALGAGLAATIVLVGLLLAASTPTKGSIAWKLRVYRLAATVAVVGPLLAALPSLAAGRWRDAGLAVVSIGFLYEWRQIDWREVRDHLERIRAADDPDDVRWIPEESMSLSRHVMYGVVLALVPAGLLPLGRAPPSVAVLLALAFYVAAVAAVGATPHRGTVERTVLALRTLLVGPGLCLVLAALASVHAGGPLANAGVLALVGGALLYVGVVRVDWGRFEEHLRELRKTDPVTWTGYAEAKQRVASRESGT